MPFRHLLWMIAGLALVVAPHMERLPWWLNLIASVLIAARIYLGWAVRSMPGRWILILLVAGGLFGVYLTYRTIFGRDAGVALLVIFLSIKLLEMRSQRDALVLVLMAYFVALTNFFYSQTLATAGLILVSVLIITTSLVNFSAPSRSIRDNARTAGTLLLQAGPVMVLLFFLFPRVQGPLWGMPQEASSAITGLSDSMSPGAISRLSQSDAIAFRVKFEKEPPPKQQLYWRGPVFWHFDGRTWRPGSTRAGNQLKFQASGNPYDYEVTLEAHNQPWLFALELAAKIPPNARVTSDYILLSRVPVRNRLRYDMRSYPNYTARGGDDEDEYEPALQLPRRFNPKARALAEEWANSLKSDTAIVERVLRHFREEGFAYTLEPPLLGRDTVDEFLFDSKRGFCEHFASTFVYLMRAAGVPARVVTGYQGGDLNPVDQVMVVRQSDAHAWAEVWLKGRGWVRFDPTAAVAPIRLESGVAAAVPATDPLPMMARTGFNLLIQIRYNYEAFVHKWNRLVLGYNPERQRLFLIDWGMNEPSWENMAMTMFWGIFGLMAATTAWLLRKMRSIDPVQRAWLAFCAKFAKRGQPRFPHEGPADFAVRIAQSHPAKAENIRTIAGYYIALRYGDQPGASSLAQLRRLVREFTL